MSSKTAQECTLARLIAEKSFPSGDAECIESDPIQSVFSNIQAVVASREIVQSLSSLSTPETDKSTDLDLSVEVKMNLYVKPLKKWIRTLNIMKK